MNMGFCPSLSAMSLSSIPSPVHQRVGSGGLVSAPAGLEGGSARRGTCQCARPVTWSPQPGWSDWLEGLLSQYAAGADQVRARVDDYTYILLIRRYRVTSGTTFAGHDDAQPDGRGYQQQDLHLPGLPLVPVTGVIYVPCRETL